MIVLLAMSSTICWWPLAINLLLQEPLLHRFAWDVYANRPMEAPATSGVAGLFILESARADPNGVVLLVWGGGVIDYAPNQTYRWHMKYGYYPEDAPWYLQWAVAPSGRNWTVMSHKFRWLRNHLR